MFTFASKGSTRYLALLGQPRKSQDFFFHWGLRPPDTPFKKASGLQDYLDSHLKNAWPSLPDEKALESCRPLHNRKSHPSMADGSTANRCISENLKGCFVCLNTRLPETLCNTSHLVAACSMDSPLQYFYWLFLGIFHWLFIAMCQAHFQKVAWTNELSSRLHFWAHF